MKSSNGSNVAGTASLANVLARCWLIGLEIPCLGVLAWELWNVVAHPERPGGGQMLIVAGMYAGGFALGTVARLFLSAPVVLALGAVVFLAGQPLGIAAASLGIYALVLPMAGIGMLAAAALCGFSGGLLRK